MKEISIVHISDMDIICRKCFRTVHTGELFCRLHGGSQDERDEQIFRQSFPERVRELSFNN